MTLLNRALLIWLLVLAVPAQAAAAATMAFCDPAHHGGGQGAIVQQRSAGQHAHHRIGAQVPHEHPVSAAQPDEDTSAPANAPTPAKPVPTDKHKCSACASCCSVGAILTSVLAVPAPDLSATVFIAVVPMVEPFVTEGLDRPPRLFLA